jgi:hypothetical protein
VLSSLTHLPDIHDNVDNTGSQPSELLTVTQLPDASQSQLVVVGRKFQSSWKSKYPWIKYCSSRCKVFCEVCQKCDELSLFSFSQSRDDAFTIIGYDNWKNSLAKFSKHEASKSHQEAVLKVANATSGTNVAGQLSRSLDHEREVARSALMCIVSTLHYLCTQGLAVRGHTECTGNFENLLKLRAADNASLKSWLDRSGYRWLSPAIQNEIIQDMALSLLRSFKQHFCDARYFAIVMDETTDASCKEQVSICLRYVTQSLQVHETFTGFYETASTTASTMFDITKDVLTRFELQLSNCRGQCFDGASNMAGNVTGLQKRICEVEPKALFVHCMNHSLSLSFQDAMSYIPHCRDAMNLIKDLINFVRDSPKRLAWFVTFQDHDTGALRPLCPTRWTMRVSSVKSVLNNYSELLSFLQDVSDTSRSDAGYKASGFLRQLLTFSTFCSLKMIYEVFSRSESLARSLQSPKLSLSKAEGMVNALTCLLNSLRSDSSFITFWEAVVSEAANLGNGIEPVMPRIRRIPRRIDDGSSQHEDQTVEDIYRRLYFSSLDAATTCLSSRFQNSAFNLARNMESVCIEVINNGIGNVPSMRDILVHYGDDIDESRLFLHLSMLADLCRSSNPPVIVTDISDAVQLFKDNEVWSQMLPEVVNFLRLYLTLPVTSCTAERSFSCLRRLKTFLRSTVSQKRLNHIALLHCHRDQTLDLAEICNTFIVKNEMRQKTFSNFPKTTQRS